MKKLLTGVLLMVIITINAQDKVTLDTLIITSRVTLKDPSNIRVIKDLKTNTDLSETLIYEPNITTISDNGNYKGYSYFRIRGMNQNKISIEYDGLPLLDAEDNGLYLSNFGALLNYSRNITVERGATISGLSSSYAGRINIEPDFYREYVSINIGSWNNRDINFSKKLGNLKVGLSLSNTEGYRNDSSNKNFSSSIMYRTGNWEFNTIAGSQSNNLAWLGSLESDILSDRRHNQSRNETDRFTQTLSYIKYSTKNLIIQPYYSFLRGGYDFNLSTFLYLNAPDQISRYELKHNRFGIKAAYKFKLGKVKNTFETNGSIFNRRHWGEGYRNRGFKNELSTSLKNQYTFKGIDIFSILQFRNATFDYKGDKPFEKISWSFLNWKAGIGYKNYYYNFGKIGREPTRTDLFFGEENFTNLNDVGPETSFSHELGYKTRRFSINGYYTSFDNEIALNGLIGSNSLPLRSSVDESTRYGIEYLLNIKTFVDLNINGSFNRNKINDDTDHVLSPETTFNIEAYKKIWGFNASLRYSYISEVFINTENTFTLPERNDFSITLNKTISNVKVNLRVNNIFNANYFTSGNINPNGDAVYFVNPETNFLLGVTCNL